MRPFFEQAKGLAIRAFADLVNDPSTVVGKHPQDFTLFEIGNFDQDNGEIIVQDKRSIGNGVEFLELKKDEKVLDLNKAINDNMSM